MEKLDWLSADFLTQCLKPEPGLQDIVITQFSSSRAVPLGEQFSSCLLRVKIEYKTNNQSEELHNISLIVKSELLAGATKEFVDSFECSESLVYLKVLPKVRTVSNAPVTAKSFFSPNPSTIVLEDLKEIGFVLADKTKGLDFEHCRLYVGAAAALHAASPALLAEDPGLKTSIIGKEKLFSLTQPGTNGLITTGAVGMRCLAEYVKTTDRFNKYADLIMECSESIFDMVVEAVKPREEDFNVIVQGDCWTNNLMFRYDDTGSACEVRLLDFQLTRYASPLMDLVFFIWTSANDDVRDNGLHDLFTVYVEELNKNLKHNECSERLSYESAMVVVNRLRPLAMYFAVVSPPILAEKPIQSADIFFTKGQEENSYKIYKSYYTDGIFFKHRLPKLVEQLEKQGVFEYLEYCNIQSKVECRK